jgi:hypothetical protein
MASDNANRANNPNQDDHNGNSRGHKWRRRNNQDINHQQQWHINHNGNKCILIDDYGWHK